MTQERVAGSWAALPPPSHSSKSSRPLNLTLLLLLWLGTLLLMISVTQCQSLKGRDHQCKPEEEGKMVYVTMTGGITLQCRCKKGIVANCKLADSKHCKRALEGCHYAEDSKKGICPKVCKSCVKDGARFPSGKVWTEPGDECSANHCFSGVITSSKVHCPVPMCSNPVTPPGQCCPTCKGCQRGLQPFAEGETKADIMDPCNQCTCQNNMLTCTRTACPALPCQSHLIKEVPGKCCPVCARMHESGGVGISNMCLFKGKVYSIGSSLQTDKCTKCTCLGSLNMQCQRETCPPLPCPKSAQIPGSGGSCCPKCPATALVPKPLTQKSALQANRPMYCTHNGRTYDNGQKWTDQCKECTCTHGEIKCAKEECPIPRCPGNSVLVQKEGQCCPSCEHRDGVCTVFGDPHYKTFDGRIFNFQGSCKYLLARDCGPPILGGATMGKKNSSSAFSIRITNDARDSWAFSWLRTITVRLDGYKVSLMQRMKVKVDGKRVNLPYIKLGSFSVMKDGYRVVLRTNTGKQALIQNKIYCHDYFHLQLF